MARLTKKMFEEELNAFGKTTDSGRISRAFAHITRLSSPSRATRNKARLGSILRNGSSWAFNSMFEKWKKGQKIEELI